MVIVAIYYNWFLYLRLEIFLKYANTLHDSLSLTLELFKILALYFQPSTVKRKIKKFFIMREKHEICNAESLSSLSLRADVLSRFMGIYFLIRRLWCEAFFTFLLLSPRAALSTNFARFTSQKITIKSNNRWRQKLHAWDDDKQSVMENSLNWWRVKSAPALYSTWGNCQGHS